MEALRAAWGRSCSRATSSPACGRASARSAEGEYGDHSLGVQGLGHHLREAEGLSDLQGGFDGSQRALEIASQIQETASARRGWPGPRRAPHRTGLRRPFPSARWPRRGSPGEVDVRRRGRAPGRSVDVSIGGETSWPARSVPAPGRFAHPARPSGQPARGDGEERGLPRALACSKYR